MDESWDIPMGLMIPRRRSAEECRRRDCEGSDVLDPEYFRDVFGGPPRTVLLQRFSRKLSGGGAWRAESIYDTEDGGVAAAAAGGARFSKSRAPARVRTEVGFYDDIFGSDDRRSRLVSTSQSKSSSSVLSSGELSLPVGDDIAFSSSASNLRETSNPTGRRPNCSPASTSSIGAPPTNRGNRSHALNHPFPPPISCGIDFAGQPEAAINKLRQRSRCFSPPDTINFKPSFCQYEKKTAADASENIASSSVFSSAFLKSKRGVRSQTHGHYPSFSEREVEKRAVEVEAAKIPCYFESGATAAKTTDGAVDEAIAWVKEKFSSRVTNEHEAL